MGQEVSDPNHIEGPIEHIAGLGILPVKTTIEAGKRSRQSTFTMVHNGAQGRGYEIHSGVTPTSRPLLTLDDGTSDGYFESDSCWGSYLHGIFDNESIIEQVLSTVNKGFVTSESYAESKQRNYNALADHIRKHIDMERIYKILEQ